MMDRDEKLADSTKRGFTASNGTSDRREGKTRTKKKTKKDEKEERKGEGGKLSRNERGRRARHSDFSAGGILKPV